jgi:hypothetical protein
LTIENFAIHKAMSTANLNCHDYFVLISFFACIVGLWLLSDRNNELEETEQTLLGMIFAYWLIYCIAVSVLHLNLPEDWQIVQNLRLTGIFSYLLTFSCLVSLPLHKLSVRHIED